MHPHELISAAGDYIQTHESLGWEQRSNRLSTECVRLTHSQRVTSSLIFVPSGVYGEMSGILRSPQRALLDRTQSPILTLTECCRALQSISDIFQLFLRLDSTYMLLFTLLELYEVAGGLDGEP